ncbi:hypothetical protein FRACA_3590005 [Frankia canadensis]|uniref:Uncharacterized protein n=1 Tax=Frankia canadensis TaxID=1836972 RepID=A0A2I2KVG7_9ACTN|nr:hypothetical protein FRACA_3590005 [Frankia canadensis]SOU56936.1 hypothetical protein FRACA_3590005 [Frankia canadensis]
MHLGDPLNITDASRTNKHTTIITPRHPMVRQPADPTPKS